ncbi:hypothetical protein BT63DRAFT_376284 [Microthyrium microscopicum]|uniref:Arrestin C-terminal-like domain-containing protein n=1 Tax=Microthyrium microscopicum TaxID=703497 RepID=A0A6A6U5I1_9PEZI|nr:hypothetical protein BT63DRAFT_376284 [Microthyrium microscopicum]
MRTSNIRQSVLEPFGNSSLVINEEANHSSPNLLPNTGQRIPDEKPIASGNGVSMAIALAEPVLFLQGFEHGDLAANRSTAMLRGSLHLKVTKPIKIKTVSLRFNGKAITRWPEGIPPKKQEFDEVNTIMSHTWPFFNAQFPTAELSTGADHVELQNKQEPQIQAKRGSLDMRDLLRKANSSNPSLSREDQRDKRLSLQVGGDSRSFGKADNSGSSSVSQRGYKTFQPGDYIYNFELPLDSHLPETIDVDLGAVKYELEASLERAGTFKANLLGTKEVVVIRTPAEGSLEQVEPIAISRNWDDQLHYDIVISGKSFPLGSTIPIAFKLTPLAKVHCHRIKVYVTEAVEYFCANKRVHRTEPARKILLFEKRSDGPPVSTFPGSTMRIISGGGVPYDMRAAAARGEPVPGIDPNNLLGNLENHDRGIGPTEMELNVQLPTCAAMGGIKDKQSKMHFDTTYSNIRVHHWIKIVLRLSKPDAIDPSKRRHFEISIDSPFHILSCRATQANTSLPAYSGPDPHASQGNLADCGCPGAPRRRSSPTSFMPGLGTFGSQSPHPGSARNSTDFSPDYSQRAPSLQPPPMAHLSGDSSPLPPNSPTSHAAPRPMHIIRAPSFNPPAFDDEDPPPPLMTPPPQYDSIASPTTGLSDYFARLSDAYASDTGTDTGSEDLAMLEVEPEGMRTPRQRNSVELVGPSAPPPAAPAAAGAVGSWI